MIGRASGGLFGIALFAAAASLAQPPAGGTATLKGNRNDPNRMVCRTFEGSSRLDRQHVCHTAAEWADLRRQTRATIDHIQTSHSTNY